MQHLAVIPDGNRRWALRNKLESFLGHQRGLEAAQNTIRACIKRGIKFLSFYTFSIENFNRLESEKKYLFSLLANEFSKNLPKLIKNGIKVKFIGDTSYFPMQIKDTIVNIEEQTKDLGKLNLNILFCYGARQEIVSAVKDIVKRVTNGVLTIDQIDEDLISNSLWTKGIPEPDLIIRTSGVIRLSNFLLFQSAYSEFMFLNCYWPEITEENILECVDKFESVKRNFGK
jgi:undecaprenyl diphosphate synthase